MPVLCTFQGQGRIFLGRVCVKNFRWTTVKDFPKHWHTCVRHCVCCIWIFFQIHVSVKFIGATQTHEYEVPLNCAHKINKTKLSSHKEIKFGWILVILILFYVTALFYFIDFLPLWKMCWTRSKHFFQLTLIC